VVTLLVFASNLIPVLVQHGLGLLLIEGGRMKVCKQQSAKHFLACREKGGGGIRKHAGFGRFMVVGCGSALLLKSGFYPR